MAGPHVAGAVALLISAYPWLAGNVAALENVLEQSAVHLTTTQGCGGDTSSSVPNNVYGWGRINALAAYNAACRRAWCSERRYHQQNRRQQSATELEPGVGSHWIRGVVRRQRPVLHAATWRRLPR